MTVKKAAATAADELVSDSAGLATGGLVEPPESGQAPLIVGESGCVFAPPRAFINTGAVDLVLTQPSAVVKPGHVIELEFGVRHRDLRPATPDEIKAAADAEAAEHAAAAAEADTATSGQE